MTTWFPIGLDGRSSINVMEGAYGATGGGTSADTTAISAAISAMTTLGKKVLIFPSNYTFLTGPLTYNVANSHIVIMPGCTLKFAASQAADAKLLNITADDVTVHVFGTLDGNRANQSNAGQVGVFSDGYDRVKVIGYGQQGNVTGWNGYGIWLKNGDDLQVKEIRGSDTKLNIVVLENTSATTTMLRPIIEGCFGDRSAESGDAGGQGVFKIIYSAGTSGGNTGSVKDGHIRACTMLMSTTATNVPGEIWGASVSDAASLWPMVNCTIDRCYTQGASIGQSIARGTGCRIISPIARDFTFIGAELAGCTKSAVDSPDCISNGTAGAIGVSIDNQSANGVGLGVTSPQIEQCAYGVKFDGGSSVGIDQAWVTGGAIRNMLSNAVAVLASRVTEISITGLVAKLTGATSIGLNLFATHGAATGNTLNVAGTGIQLADCTGMNVGGNAIHGNSAVYGLFITGSNSYITAIGGAFTGTFSQSPCTIEASTGKTVGKITLGWWTQESTTHVLLSNNSGTFTGPINVYPCNGATVFSVTKLEILDYTPSAYTINGEYSGDPNGAVTSRIGGRIWDMTSGKLWINTNGSTAWT